MSFYSKTLILLSLCLPLFYAPTSNLYADSSSSPFLDTSCAPCEQTICTLSPKRYNQFYIGPECYYLERKREGGTKQQGWIPGVRLGYDRIKPWGFYWGFDGFYGSGSISGHSASGLKIKSHYTDANTEGRLGFTFQQECGYRFSVTPFAGGGYALEKNRFVDPSPLHVHFRLQYGFVCAGFLSQMSWSETFDIGLNFKAKYMIDAKNTISNDPAFDPSTSLIGNEFLYRVELPLTYRPVFNCFDQGYISLVPFYEFRHYGGHAGFPFDFLDTKLNLYGVQLKFIYCL